MRNTWNKVSSVEIASADVSSKNQNFIVFVFVTNHQSFRRRWSITPRGLKHVCRRGSFVLTKTSLFPRFLAKLSSDRIRIVFYEHTVFTYTPVSPVTMARLRLTFIARYRSRSFSFHTTRHVDTYVSIASGKTSGSARSAFSRKSLDFSRSVSRYL